MQEHVQAETRPHADPTAGGVTLVPSCTLDQRGLEGQRERYRRAAGAVVHIGRERQLLIVDFAPSFDRQALAELIAVERECCPFFSFSFDEQRRRLQVGVRETDHAAALAAIEAAFSASG
jgi:hypothetical protein